jgi:ParB-like chromosome segregation protein Spo0J
MQINPGLLTPHPLNEKIYGKESISVLKERIASSQWIKPLVVTPNMVIISGHKRWRVALELGLDVPVEERVFTNELDELEALLLENDARNKTVEQNVREAQYWHTIETERAKQRMKDAAKAQRQGMQNFAYPHKGTTRDQVAKKVGLGTGFTYEKAKVVVTTADKLIAEGKKETGQTLLHILNNKSVHKAYQEVKKQIKQEQMSRLEMAMLTPVTGEARLPVKEGQLWQLGRHLLYCGNSASEGYIAMCKKSHATFAFADPPYNANTAEWDKDFLWKHDYLIEIAPIVAVTPGIASIQSFMRITTMPYVWSMAYWIDNGMTRGALGFGNWIYVALFSQISLYRNAQDFKQVTLLGSENNDTQHRGRKPLAILLHLINLFTKEGETVVDSFLGSGSTLIGCEQRKRICIGAEINPLFCEAIIQRWQKITGQKAERRNN